MTGSIEEIWRFREYRGYGLIEFLPDNSVLAIANGDGRVRLWDMTTRSEHAIRVMEGPEMAIQVAFSPNGRFVASTSLISATSWCAKTCQEIETKRMFKLIGDLWGNADLGY